MAILAVDSSAGTFDQQCQACGLVRRGLSLDPTKGDLAVQGAERNIKIRSCPACRARGILTNEGLLLSLSGFEAKEEGAALPEWSIVGAYDEQSGGMVSEHHIGTHHDPARVEQAALIRQMNRYEAIQSLAPLHEHWMAAEKVKARSAVAIAQREHDFDLLDGMAPHIP